VEAQGVDGGGLESDCVEGEEAPAGVHLSSPDAAIAHRELRRVERAPERGLEPDAAMVRGRQQVQHGAGVPAVGSGRVGRGAAGEGPCGEGGCGAERAAQEVASGQQGALGVARRAASRARVQFTSQLRHRDRSQRSAGSRASMPVLAPACVCALATDAGMDNR
jgi:uncharacterized low-complexity protein